MTILHNVNDAIEGERIACQFRKNSEIRVTAGTSRHRARQMNLRDAFAVIEEEYEFVKKQGTPSVTKP